MTGEPMSDQVFTNIAAYFDGLVRQYGHDIRAIDYGRATTQTLKFSILCDGLDLAGRSVLDVGCGFADLSRYLAARNIDVAYRGIDISGEMIAAARALDPALPLLHGNILEADIPEKSVDIVIATGVFYLLGPDAEALSRRLIERTFSIAREAVAFSTLSTWAPYVENGEHHSDPAALLDFCRNLTPHVALRHDYHPRDMTFFLYRSPRT